MPGDMVKKAVARGAVGGGLLGELAGKVVSGGGLKAATVPGNHKGVVYVAAGTEKVGFFSIKQGLIKTKVGELLVDHPRSDLVGIEIDKGVMPTAHFVFEDGTHYVLKCARADLKNLKKVQTALTTP